MEQLLGKNLLDFGGLTPYPDCLGALFSDMKCPRVPFECGAGGAIAIWAMPKYLRGRELSVDNFGCSRFKVADMEVDMVVDLKVDLVADMVG